MTRPDRRRPRSAGPAALAAVPGAVATAIVALVLHGPAAPSMALAQDPAQQPSALEKFATTPESPVELWEAVDYMMRVGRPDRAASYLAAFLAVEPDDETLLAIRDRFGIGSILRLQDAPQTRAQAAPLVARVAAAANRRSRDPERIATFIDPLTASPDEQVVALEALRPSGPYAAAAIVAALADPNRDAEGRAKLGDALGRLDRRALPAVAAALESPDPVVATAAADALARIGDKRAVPFLTYPAAQPDREAMHEPARRAIERLTDRPFGQQPRTPVRALADEAWKYHRHGYEFPEGPVEVWSWSGDRPEPAVVPAAEAEARLGLKFARQALAIDPADAEAQAAVLSLSLQRAVDQNGFEAFLGGDPSGAYAEALAAGPSRLSVVLKRAMADRRPDLAAAAALALGRVIDRNALAPNVQPPALVEALTYPDRRVQFAAARSLVELAPRVPFAGSSRVVPTLSRFILNSSAPKVVVIDGATDRANKVADIMKQVGYDARVASDAQEGFRLASETGDVEIVLIDPTALAGPWNSRDALANLRADARTAGIPVVLLSPQGREAAERLGAYADEYPNVAVLISPADEDLFKAQLADRLAKLGARGLSESERVNYARGATTLLSQVAGQPGGPYFGDLAAAGESLRLALNSPVVGPQAAFALAEVPGAEAQRGLADVVLDPSRPPGARVDAAGSLVRSLQRFGPLLTAAQERRLVEARDAAGADRAIAVSLSNVIGALRPQAEVAGRRLRGFDPTTAPPAPAPATPPAPAAPTDGA